MNYVTGSGVRPAYPTTMGSHITSGEGETILTRGHRHPGRREPECRNEHCGRDNVPGSAAIAFPLRGAIPMPVVVDHDPRICTTLRDYFESAAWADEMRIARLSHAKSAEPVPPRFGNRTIYLPRR